MSGTLTLTGLGTYNGNWTGQLFGPAAQETGGTFMATDGGTGALSGGFIGNRDDGLLAADKGLAELTQPASFKVQAVNLLSTVPWTMDVVYDPAAGT
jgi:hypothetical protein